MIRIKIYAVTVPFKLQADAIANGQSFEAINLTTMPDPLSALITTKLLGHT